MSRKEKRITCIAQHLHIVLFLTFTFLNLSDLFKGRKEPPVLAGILLGQLFDEKSRGGVSWLLLRIHPVSKKFKKKTIERKETDIDKER